jgi:hypothetical protein
MMTRLLFACSIVCLAPWLGCRQQVLVAVLDGSTNDPTCPAADPIPGACTKEGWICVYATDCGLYAMCSGGHWTEVPHACGQLPDGGVQVMPDLGPPPACGTGSCKANEICVHVCDCCGILTFDGGPPPASHDECAPNVGQCITTGPFDYNARSCLCMSQLEAECPCI